MLSWTVKSHDPVHSHTSPVWNAVINVSLARKSCGAMPTPARGTVFAHIAQQKPCPGAREALCMLKREALCQTPVENTRGEGKGSNLIKIPCSRPVTPFTKHTTPYRESSVYSVANQDGWTAQKLAFCHCLLALVWKTKQETSCNSFLTTA